MKFDNIDVTFNGVPVGRASYADHHEFGTRPKVRRDGKGPVWFDEPAVCPEPPAPRLTGPWLVLGIQPTHDQRAVKRAYAQALRACGGAEGDPAVFQQVRDAYEAALRGPQPADSDEDGPYHGSFDVKMDPREYDDFFEAVLRAAEPRRDTWMDAACALKGRLWLHLQGYAGVRVTISLMENMREDIARLCYREQQDGTWPAEYPLPLFALVEDFWDGGEQGGLLLIATDPRTGRRF